MRCKFMLLWAGILAVCIITGILTRLSYNHDKTHRDISTFLYSGSFNSQYLEIKTLDQLDAESELIVKVRKSGEWQKQIETTLTGVNVIDVFKGDMDLIGKHIYIYEPSYFQFKSSLYFSVLGYNLMQEGKEYILFLQHKKYSEYETLNDIQKNSYVVTTNSAFGKYQVNSDFQNVILDSGKEQTYGQIKDLEIIVCDKKELDYYNLIKSQVSAKYLK